MWFFKIIAYNLKILVTSDNFAITWKCDTCWFSLYRRDKLWICMEFCGGGSLQDIYHGKTKVAFYRDEVAFLKIYLLY